MFPFVNGQIQNLVTIATLQSPILESLPLYAGGIGFPVNPRIGITGCHIFLSRLCILINLHLDGLPFLTTIFIPGLVFIETRLIIGNPIHLPCKRLTDSGGWPLYKLVMMKFEIQNVCAETAGAVHIIDIISSRIRICLSIYTPNV